MSRSRNKDVFVAPGGKVESGEGAFETLQRELKEEFGIEIKRKNIKEFGTFYAQAAGNEDNMLRMDVFTVEDWRNDPVPSAEIEEIRWISSGIPKDMKVGSIFEHEAIPKLKSDNLID